MHAPDRFPQELERRLEVPLAVLDLPREHGRPELQDAGLFIRHDGIFFFSNKNNERVERGDVS